MQFTSKTCSGSSPVICAHLPVRIYLCTFRGSVVSATLRRICTPLFSCTNPSQPIDCIELDWIEFPENEVLQRPPHAYFTSSRQLMRLPSGLGEA